MYLALGEGRAGQIMAMVVNALRREMRVLHAAARRGDQAGLADSARRVARLAAPLGLTGLAQAASGVAGAAERGDDTAISATGQRLDRVVARSLALVRQLGDGSG